MILLIISLYLYFFIPFIPLFLYTFTSEHAWCSGTGTDKDPYIISGVVLDASGTLNCITIQNSNKHFLLSNCRFFNTHSGEGIGICFKNVSHAHIYNSEIYNNGQHGIEISNSDNIYCYDSSFHNNTYSSINLGGVKDSIISGNTVDNHSGYGIDCFNCKDIQVLNNYISLSGTSGIRSIDSQGATIYLNSVFESANGILLRNSSYSSITKNDIYTIDECGIMLEYYSNYNNITYNTITDAKDCILIGDSCVGTYFHNNGDCTPSTFNDIPEDSNGNGENETNGNGGEDEAPLEIGINTGFLIGIILVSSVVFVIIRRFRLKNGIQ